MKALRYVSSEASARGCLSPCFISASWDFALHKTEGCSPSRVFFKTGDFMLSRKELLQFEKEGIESSGETWWSLPLFV